jgi:hypothetical protein
MVLGNILGNMFPFPFLGIVKFLKCFPKNKPSAIKKHNFNESHDCNIEILIKVSSIFMIFH